MSERGMPIADGAHACPFVAFEDDRDERATVPDHRHRCYAEIRPAPRALAHQEAYCLSSAFPVCPTFQDWARRESARARDARQAADAREAAEVDLAGRAGAEDPRTRGSAADDDADATTGATPLDPLAGSAGAVASGLAAAAGAAGDDDDPDDDAPEDRRPPGPDDDEPRRNPPRDWSAPPPWLASNEAGSRPVASDPPDFLASRSEPGRGLAGSAADQLAGGPPPPRRQPPSVARQPVEPDQDGDVDFEGRDLPRPALPSRRPRAYDQHLGGPTRGPDWERPRRYEAYPTIRTRMGMPAVPRIAVLAGALVVAALAIFFLPALLGFGGGDTADASPSPSPAASQSAAPPTPTPAPTPILYTIKKGDTLSKIATANGITLDQLMAANPDIKNPNRISEGQEITIPTPEPDDFGGSEAPSEAP